MWSDTQGDTFIDDVLQHTWGRRPPRVHWQGSNMYAHSSFGSENHPPAVHKLKRERADFECPHTAELIETLGALHETLTTCGGGGQCVLNHMARRLSAILCGQRPVVDALWDHSEALWQAWDRVAQLSAAAGLENTLAALPPPLRACVLPQLSGVRSLAERGLQRERKHSRTSF